MMNDSYDRCRTCGAELPQGIAAFAGYASDGSPLYVGECCGSSIQELATHVYWWWEADKRVAPDAVLWRYMDFARFVALLDQQALHFARTDQFDDRFEAASGAKGLKPRWDAHYLDFFRHAIKTVPGLTEPPPDEEVEREAARLLQEFSQSAALDRERLFVSCWHANAGESEALWRLYCPPPIAGLAIQTTAERLTRAVGDAPVKIGKVQYVDFASGVAGIHDRIFAKRKSLSHETEVRLVIQEFHATGEIGKSIPVDVESLMAAVVPSPFAPPWFTRVLEATLGRYGVSANLRDSEILAEPFF
jgi:hypothetical protein